MVDCLAKQDRVFDQWIRLRQSRDFRFNREIIKERIDEDGDEKRPRDSYANESEGSSAEAEEGEDVTAPGEATLIDIVETESAEGGGETLDEADDEEDDDDGPSKRPRLRTDVGADQDADDE